ncbi:hypothetical protein ACIRPK_35880 [Kitasatospora sp. NPDC101801]
MKKLEQAEEQAVKPLEVEQEQATRMVIKVRKLDRLETTVQRQDPSGEF